MAKKKTTTSGTSHLLKDLNLSSEHQGIVDLVHNANKSLREGTVPKEHVGEIQNLVKEHIVHLHKVLPKDTVTTIFTRLAPAEGEPNAQLDKVLEKPKKGAVAAPKRETLGDIIDRNAAKLKEDPEYKPSTYPPKADIEEPPVTTTDDKAARRAAAKAHNEKAAALRAADRLPPTPPPSEDLHADITTKADLAAKAKEQKAKDKSLAAQLKKATAANKRLRKAAETKIEPPPPPPAPPAAPPEAATGELRLSFENPPPPPAPAPVAEKAVVEEPKAVKVEPAKIVKAAKSPSKAGVELAGVEKLTKGEDKLAPTKAPRVSPVQKKVSSIFEELKAGIANKPEGPRASKSREAIVEATQKLEAPPEKPPTVKSIFKGLKLNPVRQMEIEGPNAGANRFAISVEEENLKRASKADTTPELGSTKAKLRAEMDEAGAALRKSEPARTYTPPAKLTRPPLELPESKISTSVTKPDLNAELVRWKEKNKVFEKNSAAIARINKVTSKAPESIPSPVAEATETTPEWLRVARKAATAAEEGASVSKAAKAGETVSRMGKLASTTNKLGKLGIAGLAIYGGIEALKKIGKKLEE